MPRLMERLRAGEMRYLCVRASVTSDKGQRLVDLGHDKSGLTLSTVAATSLSCWMVGVAVGAYGWLRGTYAGGGAQTPVGGAHTAG
jgi:hypothetical protein